MSTDESERPTGPSAFRTGGDGNKITIGTLRTVGVSRILDTPGNNNEFSANDIQMFLGDAALRRLESLEAKIADSISSLSVEQGAAINDAIADVKTSDAGLMQRGLGVLKTLSLTIGVKLVSDAISEYLKGE